MPLEEIARMLDPRTFAPFRIHDVKRARYDITSPAQCLLLPHLIMVGIPSDRLPPPVLERSVHLLLTDIAKIEPLSTSASH
jgi:hypothetical protein